jgi:hypothetical protein
MMQLSGDSLAEAIAGTRTAVRRDRSRTTALRSFYLQVGLGLVVPLAVTVAYFAGAMPAPRGGLVDSDCYTHLLRAEKLWQTGLWYDSIIERSNAPYGEQLHWTRPMDVLLLVGALPAAYFLGFPSALFWWGTIFSPALLFASLLVLPWAVRPLLTKDGPRLAILFMVCQLGVLASFQPARPDHHSLLAFLFVLALGFALRLILHPLRRSLCYGAAVVFALSLWVSIESTFVIATAFAALGWLWVRREGDFLLKALHLSWATFLFTCVALLAERPWSELGALEFDRLSLVHGGLLGLLAAAGTVARRLSLSRGAGLLAGRRGRLAFALAGGAAVVIGATTVFPGLHQGPLADVDPRIIPIWLQHVQEIQPLLSDWSFSVPLLGAAAVCLPILAIWSVRRTDAAGWAYVGSSILLFVALSFYQVRWAMYAQILLAPALAEIVARHLVRPSDPGYTRHKAMMNAALIGGCCYALMFSGLLLQCLAGSDAPPEPYSRADLKRVCEYFVTTPRWQDRTCRILTHMDLGSEILYRTPHEVIATPHHRNAGGLLDTHAILTAPSFADALPLLHRRNIDLILIPRPKETIPSSASPTLYQTLLTGDAPDGCNPVELPESLGQSYVLFEIVAMETMNHPGDRNAAQSQAK